MKLVYDEWYGELSYAQRAAYRRFNVTPSEHTDLVEYFGESNHAEITKFVKDNSSTGQYRCGEMWKLMD